MQRKGNNLIVKPKPRDKTTKSRIIIPDTATPKNVEHGVIVEGFDGFKEGMNVMYYGARAYEEDGLKIISKDKIILYDYE